MTGDGRIDGKFVVKSSLTLAISEELGLTQEQKKQLGGSVWSEIMKQVAAQNQQTKIYDGGSDLYGKTNENFVVRKNQEIEFSTEIWGNIVNLVNNKLGTKIKAETPDSAKKEVGTETKAEVKKVDKKSSNTYKSNDIKVVVPQKELSKGLKKVIENRNNSTLKESLRVGDVGKINVNNVAASFDKTFNFGADTKLQTKVIFNYLTQRMNNLNLLQEGKDYTNFDLFKTLASEKQNAIIHQYRNRILKEENRLIAEQKKANYDFNKDITKIQETFDNANALLTKTLKMYPKPKIYTEKGLKHCNFPDGKSISVYYDDNGEIESIAIKHDSSLEDKEYDTNVCYQKSSAYYNIGNGGKYYGYDGKIESGYNFENLKAVAKKIFG